MLVVAVILCAIVLIVVLSIPYGLYRLLGGRPFSTSRLKFNIRHQTGRTVSDPTLDADTKEPSPRFKANYDPDVIDVKATVVERKES